MQNEKSTYPNQKYSFSFLGEIDNIYSFQTQNGYVYEVLFRPTPYLFGAESLHSSFVYELIIRVAKNNSNKKRPPFDQLVAPTIAEIFTDFYEKAPRTIAIYICDSSDNNSSDKSNLVVGLNISIKMISPSWMIPFGTRKASFILYH